MIKLVLELFRTDGYTYSSYDFIPFEWSSLGEFEMYLLMLDFTEKQYYELFGFDISEHDIKENIKVYTLDEWWETKKESI